MQPLHVTVPVFDIEAALAGIRECLESGWVGLGGKTLTFEAAWTRYTGLPYAHFTNSCTSALGLALAVLGEQHGWRQGDQILTTPLTFVATPQAIYRAGYCPVFVDVDSSGCLDPDCVERDITSLTRAVLFVGLGGRVGQLMRVQEICDRHHIPLIIDAAHCAGTRIRGVHIGHGAAATCFSFHATKNLPTGDAGMVCFADPAHDARARELACFGIDRDAFARTASDGAYRSEYDVRVLGYKAHGNAIMAAIALAGLSRLDADNARRRALAACYDKALPGWIRRPPAEADVESSQHLYQISNLYPISVRDRDTIVSGLRAAHIYPGVHYPLCTQFAPYRAFRGHTPWAAAIAATTLSLPLHCRMDEDDVLRVAQVLKDFGA